MLKAFRNDDQQFLFFFFLLKVNMKDDDEFHDAVSEPTSSDKTKLSSPDSALEGFQLLLFSGPLFTHLFHKSNELHVIFAQILDIPFFQISDGIFCFYKLYFCFLFFSLILCTAIGHSYRNCKRDVKCLGVFK